jgi:hypothetical protein
MYRNSLACVLKLTQSPSASGNPWSTAGTSLVVLLLSDSTPLDMQAAGKPFDSLLFIQHGRHLLISLPS